MFNKDRHPYDKQLADILLQIAYKHTNAKTALCEEEPMSDAPPLLFTVKVRPNGTSKLNFHTLMKYEDGFFFQDDVIKAINQVSEDIEPNKFDYAISVLEGYSTPIHELDKMSTEDMEVDFESNPFSPVKQQITITAVDWAIKNVMICCLMYNYNDKGLPEIVDADWFEFPMDTKDTGFNEIMDVLGQFCARVKERNFAKN